MDEVSKISCNMLQLYLQMLQKHWSRKLRHCWMHQLLYLKCLRWCPASSTKKFLVASKACKQRFYACTLFRNHVSCDCPAFKYQTICKHSLCVSQQNSITSAHLEFVTKKKTKGKRSTLLNPAKATAGKTGGKPKTQWRPRQQSSRETSNAGEIDLGNIPPRPFTDIHHNNEPFLVRFLTDDPEAKECRQCGVEFPRYQLIRPLNIVLSHKEKWTYSTKEEPNKRRISSKYTTKYYCIQASWRYDYFNASLVKVHVHVDDEIRHRLCSSHKELKGTG